jgi:hypothetical protein
MATANDKTTNRLDRLRAGQKPTKPPAPDKPSVTYACGHTFGLAHLAGRACPGCVNKHRRQKNRERAEARLPGLSQRGRLPDAASFLVTFDAPAGCWSGTLEVPGVGSFTGSSRGVFHLLQLLDDKYRTAATPQGA